MPHPILITNERHKHLHSVSRTPKDVLAHQARLNFELTQNDSDALAGAIADFLMADVEKSSQTTLKVLARAADALSDDWLLSLYESLFTPFTPLSPIIDSKWSILTNDIKGHFNFIHKAPLSTDPTL